MTEIKKQEEEYSKGWKRKKETEKERRQENTTKSNKRGKKIMNIEIWVTSSCDMP
jgi:hypothetical protein